jgi:hypothetical protein
VKRQRRDQAAAMASEMASAAWCFCTWWDDAVRIAQAESARTGRRHTVRKSVLYPGMWFIAEVTA